MDQFSRVQGFLSRLRDAKIYFTLSAPREEALMVTLVVPGERWEVEFMADGSVEIEVFKSDGNILGEPLLEDLFARFSE